MEELPERRIAEREAIEAATRWKVVADQEQAALSFFAVKARKWREAGASPREIGAATGVSPTEVESLIENQPAVQSTDLTRVPVPVVTMSQFFDFYQDLFGEVYEVTIAFNSSDILFESGRHPEVFAQGNGSIYVPTLMMRNARGDLITIRDCNCGYSGTGPSNSADLLRKLDWADDEVKLVFYHRFVQLRRDGDHIAERYPRTDVSVGEIQLDPSGGINIVPAPVSAFELRLARANDDPDPRLAPFTGWIGQLFDRAPRMSWADGHRVARCYLTHDAIDAANMRSNTGMMHSYRPDYISVIIEQGGTQLWCQTSIPYDSHAILSQETYHLLDMAGLYPKDLHDSEPSSRIQKLLARRPKKLPYYDICTDGTHALNRVPTGGLKLRDSEE